MLSEDCTPAILRPTEVCSQTPPDASSETHRWYLIDLHPESSSPCIVFWIEPWGPWNESTWCA